MAPALPLITTTLEQGLQDRQPPLSETNPSPPPSNSPASPTSTTTLVEYASPTSPEDPLSPLTPISINTFTGRRKWTVELLSRRIATADDVVFSDLLADYVHNTLPINLINVQDGRLYGRDAICKKIVDAYRGHQTERDAEETDRECDDETVRGKEEPKDQVARREAMQGYIKHKLQFAILSHRWLDAGVEPTFEQMSQISEEVACPYKSSVGYEKLESFRIKAQEYECDWAWADTCCIDKRSSAELDESIRSMYRWYHNAKVCIVHLAGTRPGKDWAIDMHSEVWFTRGWTLQELLAPKRIKFFACNWEVLTENDNDKEHEGLSRVISEITGIPRYQLRDFSPGVDFIREKMIWASTRKTTRVEDVAYSLVGLFDISMPIAYGEGTRAFFRLQTTLAGMTNSMDFFLWTGEPSRQHSMFASGPHCFYPNFSTDEFVNYIWTTANSTLPGGWTLEQCDTAARAFIHRGDVSFSMTNAGLRIALLPYNARILPQSKLTIDTAGRKEHEYTLKAGKLGRLTFTCGEPDLNLMGRKLMVGVLDYDWGDANRKPIRSMKHISIAHPDAHLFNKPREEKVAQQSIADARRNRWYTAVVLRVVGPERYQKLAFILVKRPASGWKKPRPVYVR